MSIAPTYPGIYIEELPSSSHTVTPAPTAIAAFVGYTHPFKTNPANWGLAVQIFSFTDYENNFGGMFSVDWLADDVGKAVYQFFLNGGTNAFVVALEPTSYYSFPPPLTVLNPIGNPALTVPPTPPAGPGVIFTGLEPVDANHQLTVAITNLRTTSGTTNDTADITLTYGTRVETYRGVVLGTAPNIEARVGTTTTPVSSLVTVAPNGTYPTAWPLAMAATPLQDANFPSGPFTTFNPGDFLPAFAADSALDKQPVYDQFDQLVTPGVWDFEVTSAALAFCEHKHAFFIMDPPADAVADQTSAPLSTIGDIMLGNVPNVTIPESPNGALYFPWLRSTDPVTSSPITLPPSGFVAGLYASEDSNRGVWKAPAGLETLLQGTQGVVPTGVVSDGRQGVLNPIGVNCIRAFPGVGTVIYGARTLVSANTALEQDKYVPVRRMTLFIERSLIESLGWVVFEPNDTPLWTAIRTEVQAFMLGLYLQGALQGPTPSQAFQVKCDSTTTTPADQDNGVVNIVVAFAPLKPAEFVVVKISQLAGQAQS
jgi:phage tail sheath protein FI